MLLVLLSGIIGILLAKESYLVTFSYKTVGYGNTREWYENCKKTAIPFFNCALRLQ
jgi:hypothetical protein